MKKVKIISAIAGQTEARKDLAEVRFLYQPNPDRNGTILLRFEPIDDLDNWQNRMGESTQIDADKDTYWESGLSEPMKIIKTTIGEQ